VATGLWPVDLEAAVHIGKKTARRAVATMAATAISSAATCAVLSARAPICLVLVVGVPLRFAICLWILVAVFAAEGAIILLPFHFPLAVFELPHGHPGFIAVRFWCQIREVFIG
jgi:hypothetical protein